MYTSVLTKSQVKWLQPKRLLLVSKWYDCWFGKNLNFVVRPWPYQSTSVSLKFQCTCAIIMTSVVYENYLVACLYLKLKKFVWWIQFPNIYHEYKYGIWITFEWVIYVDYSTQKLEKERWRECQDGDGTNEKNAHTVIPFLCTWSNYRSIQC